MQPAPPSSDSEPPRRAIRWTAGQWTVLGMLLFGCCAVGGMWLYWDRYEAPFRPLQSAIAAEFPKSSPRVIGGRHKSHLSGTPRVLRVVATVGEQEFDPSQALERSEDRVRALARLVFEHQNLDEYDELEIRLVQRRPEQSTLVFEEARPIAEWRDAFDREHAAPAEPSTAAEP